MLIDILFKLVPHHVIVMLVIGVRRFSINRFPTILLRFTSEVNIFKVTTLLNG